jgi:hypothetical protein
MLNRTNRTNSANLNRLNLGTRSLARTQGAVNGKNTLRTRHAHDFAMRDGRFGSFDPSIRPSSRIEIPSVPGSPEVEPWPVEAVAVRPAVGVPVTAVVPAAWPAHAACLSAHGHGHGQGQSLGQSQAQGQPALAKPARDASVGKRPARGYAQGAYRAADRTAAAAAPAAAGG